MTFTSIAHMPELLDSLVLVLVAAGALAAFIYGIAWSATSRCSVTKVTKRDPDLFRDQWRDEHAAYLRDMQALNTERLREQPLRMRVIR